MKSIFYSALMSLAILPTLASAHGEDKPGPNGGFIRMPGAFHTEITPIGTSKLKVFLLDIEWKNPSVRQSTVKATYISQAKTTTTGKCVAEKAFYICEFPKDIDLTKSGEIRIEAKRENQIGVPVSYALPLKLQVVDDGHGSHK